MFERFGLNRNRVKYREMLLNPNPMVSHEGITMKGGFTHELSDGEALDTWTVSYQIETFELLLNDYILEKENTLQSSLLLGDITASNFMSQMSSIRRDYSVETALLAHQPWALEIGNQFCLFESRTEGKQETVRYVWKLSPLGLPG